MSSAHPLLLRAGRLLWGWKSMSVITVPVKTGSNPIKYPTYPGAVVFMRAPGFESFKAKDRPFHYVADIDTKRYSFAVRQVRKDRVPPGQ